MSLEIEPDELTEKIRAIERRRLDAFIVAGSKSSEAKMFAVADATTLDDLDTLRQARERLDDFARLVMHLDGDIRAEYARGHRCAVCGLTAAQSAAIGYDCTREC